MPVERRFGLVDPAERDGGFMVEFGEGRNPQGDASAPALPQGREADRFMLRNLRLASVLEALTLLVLVFIAVPLRHLGGWRLATAIMGPIHGAAFLGFVWTLNQASEAGLVSRREGRLFLLAALAPFGGFLNEKVLRGKLAAEKAVDRPVLRDADPGGSSG